jgi:hypothetical protein
VSFVLPPWTSPYTVQSRLVTGPTEEPLTLDQGKLRAGLDWAAGDPRDDLMRGFIAAARAKVEQDTGLALLTQTRDVTITPGSDGTMPIPWQAYPVQTISPLVPMPLSWTWSGVYAAGSWRVVVGWPDAATLAAEAPLLVQAVGLLTAHYATFGRDLALPSGNTQASLVPLGYPEAIAPYTLVTLV